MWYVVTMFLSFAMGFLLAAVLSAGAVETRSS